VPPGYDPSDLVGGRIGFDETKASGLHKINVSAPSERRAADVERSKA
jgi:hypothetical protein